MIEQLVGQLVRSFIVALETFARARAAAGMIRDCADALRQVDLAALEELARSQPAWRRRQLRRIAAAVRELIAAAGHAAELEEAETHDDET